MPLSDSETSGGNFEASKPDPGDQVLAGEGHAVGDRPSLQAVAPPAHGKLANLNYLSAGEEAKAGGDESDQPLVSAAKTRGRKVIQSYC